MTNQITAIKTVVETILTGDFGRKALISNLWGCVNSIFTSREEFNSLLIQMNRDGLIELSRCDMVCFFSSDDIEDSRVEFRINGRVAEELHFVTVGRS